MFGQEETPIIPFTIGKYVSVGEFAGRPIYCKILHEAMHIDGGHEQTLLLEWPDGSHHTTSLSHLIELNPNGALDAKPQV